MLNMPLQMLLVTLAGWMNRQHFAVIDYLKEENRVLRELLGKKRLRTDEPIAQSLVIPLSVVVLHVLVQAAKSSSADGPVCCQRLGGMQSFYYRKAA